MSDEFRIFHRFPGTQIVLYEAKLPRPEIVLLSEHTISPGTTRARSAWDPDLQRSVNIIAGEEGEQFEQERGYGPGLPATPKRSPKIDGLGADEPKRRRIVTVQTNPSTEFDPSKPIPKDPAERARYLKAREEFIKSYQKKIQEEERRGVSVRGWRMRALSDEKEMELFGESTGTQKALTELFVRLPRDGKAWLQSALVAREDPFRFLSTSRESAVWTPWVKSNCIGWLVSEGSKRGIYFAARETPNSVEARSLQKDIQDYLDGRVRCETREVRKMGVRPASEVLGIPQIASLTMSALSLFQHYQQALRSNEESSIVHEAYHRILLHRFFQRRSLVPTTRSGAVSKEAERRANLLQAHRVFVFNSDGCPTRLNKRFLEVNGIGIDALVKKNPTLIYERNARNEYTVEEWTKWLYEKVLGKDPAQCRKVFTSESISDLRVLAGIGLLV